MFSHIPTYDKYRTLKLGMPKTPSEDVYALQRALDELGCEPGDSDGIFGPLTDRATRKAQTRLGLTVDGAAGELTQRALAMTIADPVAASKHVRREVMKGQMEHESSFRLGIYSDARPDGSYDAGVTQRNTQHTPAMQGFDPFLSIVSLAVTVRKHYDLFEGVLPERRRWMLAQGAWNAPAFACYLARAEGATKVTKAMTRQPSAASRKIFEDYMTKVSKYLPDYL
jgi:Putative peptidoglycan binding domain